MEQTGIPENAIASVEDFVPEVGTIENFLDDTKDVKMSNSNTQSPSKYEADSDRSVLHKEIKIIILLKNLLCN